MVRRQVALVERALRTGQLVDLPGGFGHEPAWQDALAAGSAFEDLALGILIYFDGRDSGDHDYRGIAVEEHLLDEGLETVGLRIVLQVEAHVSHELVIAEA